MPETVLTQHDVTKVRAGANAITVTSSPAEILAFVKVIEETLVEFLRQRGMSGEVAEARRKEIVAEETVFIDSEIERYDTKRD